MAKKSLIPEGVTTQRVPLALVEWEDAWASRSGEYFTLESIKESTPYISHITGYVIRDDDSGVTVAQESLTDGRFRSVHHVPRGMVRRITILTCPTS